MEQDESVSNVVRDAFDKLNRRFDSIENKVSDIHATHERIKKEASFKRQYSEIPPLTNYDEIDDDADYELTPMNKKTTCGCCTIQ